MAQDVKKVTGMTAVLSYGLMLFGTLGSVIFIGIICRMFYELYMAGFNLFGWLS